MHVYRQVEVDLPRYERLRHGPKAKGPVSSTWWRGPGQVLTSSHPEESQNATLYTIFEPCSRYNYS